jgi:translation elongation factor EF-Tu-like GTPase
MAKLPDFEAEVRILTSEEVGDGRPVFLFQGCRHDIHLDDQPSEGNWMIHPRFIDDSGELLSGDELIPPISKALFYIINEELRRTIHREWLDVGTRFHIRAGGRPLAACRITKILGLHDDYD